MQHSPAPRRVENKIFGIEKGIFSFFHKQLYSMIGMITCGNKMRVADLLGLENSGDERTGACLTTGRTSFPVAVFSSAERVIESVLYFHSTTQADGECSRGLVSSTIQTVVDHFERLLSEPTVSLNQCLQTASENA